MNTPILAGMILSPPTMATTVFWQWVNQSYMAGFNYQNKNPESVFTNGDLAKGYCASVTASILVAIALRKLSNSFIPKVSGSRLLLVNTTVAAVSCSAAAYVNTKLMRQPEAVAGIPVFSSATMSKQNFVGVSRICAEQAILETAVSRMALGSIACILPSLLLVPLTSMPLFRPYYQRCGNFTK